MYSSPWFCPGLLNIIFLFLYFEVNLRWCSCFRKTVWNVDYLHPWEMLNCLPCFCYSLTLKKEWCHENMILLQCQQKVNEYISKVWKYAISIRDGGLAKHEVDRTQYNVIYCPTTMSIQRCMRRSMMFKQHCIRIQICLSKTNTSYK